MALEETGNLLDFRVKAEGVDHAVGTPIHVEELQLAADNLEIGISREKTQLVVQVLLGQHVIPIEEDHVIFCRDDLAV